MQVITDADINYAENILFGRIGVFDTERIAYIKELNTCDLYAVPGSGKTTVLLAKLLIIERYLPLENGKNILVISHTNAAVDEIKERIGTYCPKLFSEPNFVGTIQAFVDKFLAIPFYTNKFKTKPLRIDDEIYSEKASQFSRVSIRGYTSQEQNNAKYYLRANKNAHTIRFSEVGDRVELTTSYLGNPIVINKPRGNTQAQNYTPWSTEEIARVKKWIIEFKVELFKQGYLSFDDAYFLASQFLAKYPLVKIIIQKRFGYAFIDEMQDMDKHQYDILERLFFDDGNSLTIYQRIGDNNQAIFSEGKEIESLWVERGVIHQITGSHRLTPAIARVVQSLALNPIEVVGLNINAEGRYIKPHIILYTDANKANVIEVFANIIRENKRLGLIDDTPKYPFKAICWNTKQEVNKIRIHDFYPAFSKEQQKLRVNHSCLESYLYLYDRETKSINSVYKNILNGLLRVLRLEGIDNGSGKQFSKKTFIKYLSENSQVLYKSLQLKMFLWCEGVLKGQENIVLADIKATIPSILTLFNKTLSNSLGFVNGVHINVPYVGTLNNNRSNYPTFGDETIEVTTVHATKGQTHTGTLYLESYFQRSIQNSGNYESERLASRLLEQARPVSFHEFVRQSMKMTYVGFSRPTHLLCFAVHQSRFDVRLADLDREIWDIVVVPNT